MPTLINHWRHVPGMYVCMYVGMYVCIYVCTYICTYICMYVCMYVCMYICIHVCMCTCLYAFMYMIYIYICINDRQTGTDIFQMNVRQRKSAKLQWYPHFHCEANIIFENVYWGLYSLILSKTAIGEVIAIGWTINDPPRLQGLNKCLCVYLSACVSVCFVPTHMCVKPELFRFALGCFVTECLKRYSFMMNFHCCSIIILWVLIPLMH